MNHESFEITCAFPEFRRFFALDDSPIVLFVGRLSPMKGPDLLLEAVPEVLARRDDVRFVFCGDGVMMDALRQRATELRIEGNTVFTGYLAGGALAAVYRIADALVVPSRYEPFGMTTLEAIVCGLPVVVSGAGGLAEIAKHVEGVHMASGNAPDAIAEAVLSVLGTRTAAIPREIVQAPEQYRWPSIASQVLDVLAKLTRKDAVLPGERDVRPG